MDLKTALEIKRSFVIIQNELNVPTQKLGSLINLYNEGSYKILQEASVLWNEFDNSDIKTRAKMLGYNLVDKQINDKRED